MKQISFIIILMSILVFSGCENHKNNTDNTKKAKNSTVGKQTKLNDSNQITLHSVDGNNLTLIKDGNNLKIKGMKNKVILLDFFATWCPPCKAEIPHLVNLQKKYKNKLQIISVLLENNKPDSEIKSFIKYNSINYIITNGPNNYKLSSMMGEVQNIPFMILYNKKGNIVTHYLGAIPEEMINSDLEKVIK